MSLANFSLRYFLILSVLLLGCSKSGSTHNSIRAAKRLEPVGSEAVMPKGVSIVRSDNVFEVLVGQSKLLELNLASLYDIDRASAIDATEIDDGFPTTSAVYQQLLTHFGKIGYFTAYQKEIREKSYDVSAGRIKLTKPLKFRDLSSTDNDLILVFAIASNRILASTTLFYDRKSGNLDVASRTFANVEAGQLPSLDDLRGLSRPGAAKIFASYSGRSVQDISGELERVSLPANQLSNSPFNCFFWSHGSRGTSELISEDGSIYRIPAKFGDLSLAEGTVWRQSVDLVKVY